MAPAPRRAAALPSLPNPPPFHFSTRTWRAVDKKHGPTWHVVVGRNFGSYVTHEVCFDREARAQFCPSGSPSNLIPSLFSLSLSPLRPQTKHFIYFYLGQVAVLLFKSG